MLFACGVAVLLADQWSKRAIRAYTANRNLAWGTVVRFHCVPHREELFERAGARAALVLTWVLAAVCAAMLHRGGAWFQSGLSLAGLGLAFGGAAGNLLDILERRAVINFIDVGWWPVFNLADAAILAGLGAAFYG